VCSWINSAVDAVRDQLEKNTVEKVAICIFEVERNVVVEKWTFDLTAFPNVEKQDRDTPFERDGTEGNGSEGTFKNKINVADLEAQFRAVLSRIGSASDRLGPLPKNTECSFTVSIEVRDNADRPVGRVEKEERKWIAAEPASCADEREEQREDAEGGKDGAEREPTGPAKGKTVPVRRLEASELKMEIWVEESQDKFAPVNGT
jgi:mitotic spindle assembly checkpoint protein MAD2B